MSWKDLIIKAHTTVTDQVSHFQRMQSNRYFVWAEDGRNDLEADGIHAEGSVTGATDLFTTLEFDPWVDDLGASFSFFGIAWSLRDIQYEEDTGFYHYTWDWEVLYGDHAV